MRCLHRSNTSFRNHAVISSAFAFIAGLLCLLSIGPNTVYALPNGAGALTPQGYALEQEAASSAATHSATLDYEVCFLPNDFYDNPCAPANRQYLSSLAEYINLNFFYHLTTDAALNYDYSYSINGKITVYDRDNRTKELFQKNYRLLPEQTAQAKNTKSLEIAESYKINFQTYNSFAHLYKNSFALGGEAVFAVGMHIALTARRGTRTETRPISLNFLIPLTKQTFDIKTTTQPGKDDIFEFAGIERPSPSIWQLIIAASIIFGLALAIFLTRHHYLKTKSAHDRYNIKIHKNYGRIVVDLKTPLKPSNYQHIYEVKEFSDLVDKADRTMQNILCSKLSNGRTFYAVIENETIYFHGFPYQNHSEQTDETI